MTSTHHFSFGHICFASRSSGADERWRGMKVIPGWVKGVKKEVKIINCRCIWRADSVNTLWESSLYLLPVGIALRWGDSVQNFRVSSVAKYTKNKQLHLIQFWIPASAFILFSSLCSCSPACNQSSLKRCYSDFKWTTNGTLDVFANKTLSFACRFFKS